MPIQNGFDGIKILPDSRGRYLPSDMRTILEMTGDKYAGYVAALEYGDSEPETYWRIVFAILSVHSPIGATFAAYSRLRLWSARFERMPSVKRLASLIGTARASDGVCLYPYQKATYVHDFDAAWRHDATTYTRNGDDDNVYRLRLWRNVRGLGLAKASFAVALTAPSTSDVCCIDTHIFRILTGVRPHSSIRPSVYLHLENRVRCMARKAGISVFAAQWALWDAARGVSNPHSGLALRKA